MPTQELVFNGLDAATGDYLLAPQPPEAVARLARGLPPDEADQKDARQRRAYDAGRGDHLGLRQGLDPKDLAQAGWGVVFPADLDAKALAGLRAALKPLLDHRQAQAARQVERYYREFAGADGYRPGETKVDFLKRFGRSAGPADPQKVPYYLLLVGDPQAIPFTFQYQLDVQYAVGRIAFDDIEDYHRYALSVVQSETGSLSRPKRAAFFGTANPDDPATALSAAHLVEPLAGFFQGDQPDWQVETLLGERASKAGLAGLLNAPDGPALLFTATHGVAFPNGDGRQRAQQGALVCQDWPGPRRHRGPLPADSYFSAADLEEGAQVAGSLAFFFACYGAGTPQHDNFSRSTGGEAQPLAPQPFLARLPQRLLCHPRGGALAVIGHVDRAWGCSFHWPGLGHDLVMFESALKRLAEGYPAGAALEFFNERYAELSTDLTSELDQTTPAMQNPLKIAGLWTSTNDARNYAILGDPAVRLPSGAAATAAAVLQPVELSTARGPAARPEPALPEPAGPPAPVDALPSGTPPRPEATATGTLAGAQPGPEQEPAFQTLAAQLAQLLARLLAGASTLEVATYTSPAPGSLRFKAGEIRGARLRARSRVDLDGKVMHVLEEARDQADEATIQNAHLALLQAALADRNELLRIAAEALAGLGYSGNKL